MASRKVFIGIPLHGVELSITTVISLIVSIREILALGWDYPVFYFRVGDSDLCRARNAIIGHFLDTDCTDLVLIDSDISWEAGMLTRLVAHPKDFVCGAYRGKTDDKDVYFILWPDRKEMWTDPETGNPLLKADGSAIGFCRLTRSCVEQMVATLDKKDWMKDPFYPDEKLPWLIDFTRFPEGGRLEEGYSLCAKWRGMGGDVWVDPMINLGHIGPKIYESDLLGFLDRMRSFMLAQDVVNGRMGDHRRDLDDVLMTGLPRGNGKEPPREGLPQLPV